MRISKIIMLLLFGLKSYSQVYFPSNDSTEWDSISPLSFDYCQQNIDSLYNFLDVNNTKAFILLRDGKIVLEQYFNGHSDTSNWYWASAGKTILSFLIGVAQNDGLINIDESTSSYLSAGWTDCNIEQEEMITVRHQLTMTSGLNDNVDDPYCTIDSCLLYFTEAGTRWAYHNAPYTLLRDVIENASGLGINNYNYVKLSSQIGMNGLFVSQGYNSLFLSTARSMARFGLLMLNEGIWAGNQILADIDYFNEMINSSQDHNQSYGYLWWLNGKSSFMIPQSQYVFNGHLSPNAPADMYAAMGKNGQLINVVPSENMVWIRMGDAPGKSLVPLNLNDDIWSYINKLSCNSTNLDEKQNHKKQLIKIIDMLGRPSYNLKNKSLFYIYDDGSVEKRFMLN